MEKKFSMDLMTEEMSPEESLKALLQIPGVKIIEFVRDNKANGWSNVEIEIPETSVGKLAKWYLGEDNEDARLELEDYLI
jgi:hypothetical protein